MILDSRAFPWCMPTEPCDERTMLSITVSVEGRGTFTMKVRKVSDEFSNVMLRVLASQFCMIGLSSTVL